MQKYILIIFTFVFPLSLFADEKTEIVLDWDCKSVNYEGEVQRLPDRARVKAEIKIKDDGRFDIKLKDNIFKEGLEDKVTGFIGGLFGNKKEKTHAVDYTQCLTRFKYDFISSTQKYQSGDFDETLKLILENHKKIISIILPTLRSERQKTYSPFRNQIFRPLE